jgi:alpha-1,3-fucosyltransferase
MSHRRDSDVYLGLPYGRIRRRKNVINRIPYKQNCRQSTNRLKLLVTWFNSPCSTPSQREIYVEKLVEFIPVDIYGECGSLKCLPENDFRCERRVLGDYKFFLAAEDFLCPDYVTENFYLALMNGIVPVVYGGADYTQYAPPNSYVNVADFATPKELAEYLLLLDNNEALYSKFFEWKRDYEVIPQTADGWCDLCEKLNDPAQERKSYGNLTKWWHEDVPCLSGSSYLSSL